MRRLALAGVFAVLLFATIGQLSHHGGVSAGGYAADAIPLLCCWVAAAWWTRRFLPTWLLGVTGGVAIRAVVLSHYRWNELAFLGVALAFVGAAAGLATVTASGLAKGPVWSRHRRDPDDDDLSPEAVERP